MRQAAMVAAIALLTVAYAEASAERLSCTPPGADLANPTPIHFNDEAVAELEHAYRASEVRGLRAAIESYLAGDARPKVAALLKSTPRSILRKRFILMSDERGSFGGFFLRVQFKDHPEVMFRAWVYDIADEWDLRAWDTANCSALQQRWLRVRYGELNLMASG